MPREHGGEFYSVDGHVAVDQQPYVKAVVNGSKQISRDPLDGAESVLDPNGDRAFASEVRCGKNEEFLMCGSPTHRGERWLPFTQFSIDKSTPRGRNRYCLKCRSDAEYLRRLRQAERRGIKLRDKPGRPKNARNGN